MSHVVLLGGGYASAWAYRALVRRRVLVPDLRITVVSPYSVHAFHGFTGEVLSGELDRDLVHSPLAEVFPHADLVEGWARHVDPDARVVTVETTTGVVTVSYDQLLVATGSRENTNSVPGLAENGWCLRAPHETGELLDHLAQVGPGPVVVVGGGMSGVEAALALSHARGSVTLVSPSAPGSEMRSLAGRVRAELIRSGVRVVGARAVSVGPEGVELDDSTTLPAVAVVSALGNCAEVLPGLPVTDGCLAPALDLSVLPGVWAVGDAARVLGHRGTPVPQDALFAIRGGTHAGRQIVRTLRGLPTRRFTYRGLGNSMGCGRGRALARLWKVPITGPLAWTMRMGFFLWFVPSRPQALRLLKGYVNPTPAPLEQPTPAVA